MSKHEKTTAEVLAWDCIYGECDHEGDCPTRVVEVCAGCTVVYEPDEIDALLPWHRSAPVRLRGDRLHLRCHTLRLGSGQPNPDMR